MNLAKDANYSLVRKHLARVPDLVKEVSTTDSASRLDCVVGLGFSLTGKLFGQSVPAALKEYKGLTGTYISNSLCQYVKDLVAFFLPLVETCSSTSSLTVKIFAGNWVPNCPSSQITNDRSQNLQGIKG